MAPSRFMLCLVAVIGLAGTFIASSVASPPVSAASSNAGDAYWLVASDGGIFSYGGAGFAGSSGGMHLNQPIVGMAATPDGRGYWLVASDGGIFSYGDAAFYGSTGGKHLNKPIVGMAATPDGRGYWLVASDGGIFSFGDAAFYGSTGAMHLNQPIVGMAAMPDGRGYRLVASDGGIFSYGDAAFYGSTGGMHLNKPIVGLAATSDGRGYWLAASDGGIFSYGDAAFYGSTGAMHLNQPIVGLAATSDGRGYRLVASDGGIFTYGDAAFDGSTGGMHLNKPIVGMSTTVPTAPVGAGGGGAGGGGVGGGGAGGNCTSPVYATSDAQGTYNVDSSGPEYWWVDNDAWSGTHGPQTISVCNQSSWSAASNQPDNCSGCVQTYPNTEYDVGGRESPSTTPISGWSAISSTFSEAFPSQGNWDAGYDLWLNNWQTEIMIWNQWAGSQSYWPGQATTAVTLGGVPYHFLDNGGELMFFRDTPVSSGSVDILSAFTWLASHGYVSASDVPTQLEYGVEVCSTSGTETFPLTGLTFNLS